VNTVLFLALLALVVIACAGVLVWRSTKGRRGHRRAVLHIYRHVDEILGARKYERERVEMRRYYAGWLRDWGGVGKLAVLLWWRTPNAHAPWPPHRRRVRYVPRIEAGTWRGGKLHPLPPGEPLRLRHVHAVTLAWSSEGIANAPQFLEALERGKAGIGAGSGSSGLAQALGLEWFDGLFTRKRDDANSRLTFTRTYSQRLPEDAGWEGVADGAR
jgi:hypothetical protein